MASIGSEFFGYQGKWAWVDLTERTVRVDVADRETYRKYVGGRGVQARLLADRVAACGPIVDPLGPNNRIIIGTGPVNDTVVATAGRGSCSFISPLTRSPEPAPWIEGHSSLNGMLTHSSAGGVFPDTLKRAGIDQLIIDGRAERPVRLVVTAGRVDIVDAEENLFETRHGTRTVAPASATTDYLEAKYKDSSTLAVGPAGWNQVAFACLTGDRHRNFGRGGSGAVFGSKNLVAVTAFGRRPVTPFDRNAFRELSGRVDDQARTRALDPQRTTSFRRSTGTTWWLDRAFDGRYMGTTGGYLPWHNFDEGYFDPGDYARVGTDAFLEIAGKHTVCNRCRHVMCSRSARVESGPYAGQGVRPEFETIALWINCCLFDRAAIFYLNQRCNELGVDTMTLGAVMAAAMELSERGLLGAWDRAPEFGDAASMVTALDAIAYRSSEVGSLLGSFGDDIVARVAATRPPADREAIVGCVTNAFGGLGYAGIEPKVFPGMFAAYATSNRGRGDHTHAWTVQAEEGGLSDPKQLAAYVSESQAGKVLIDSLGLCDFFPGDVTSDLFLAMYCALTGFDYTADDLLECARRVFALERSVNNVQGRSRAYDAYVHPKLAVPLAAGPHAGKHADPRRHGEILDAYYRFNGWTPQGAVPPERLVELGAATPTLPASSGHP